MFENRKLEILRDMGSSRKKSEGEGGGQDFETGMPVSHCLDFKCRIETRNKLNYEFFVRAPHAWQFLTIST